MSNQGSKWRKDERGPYIRMYSGQKVYFFEPTAAQIRIPDVVHHAARINRYTGADTYSIGQHMVVAARMAERFYPGYDLLPGRLLIHDVAEHILGDVSAPLKSLLPDYKQLETRWDYAVEQKFGLTFIGDAMVKEVDDRMWLTERLAIYGDAMLDGVDISEDYSGPLEPFTLEDEEFCEMFYPWDTGRVEEEFETELARLVWPA